MARAATGAGFYCQTFSTFPSQIMGGPASSQVRISTTPVLSNGDAVDVLVVLNQYAFDNHIDDLSENGVCIYNAQDCVPSGDGNYFGINADELAKESGNTRAANMVILGAVATLIDFKIESIENFVTELSGLKKVLPVDLMFEFYSTYIDVSEKKNRDSFNQFLGWAPTILSDFNEMDAHLVNAQNFFEFQFSIQEITQWQKSSMLE